MLCQFTFENYKSYKDEAMLDCFAEPIDQNKESLIVDKIDSENFLPIIALYGPNGGGKSTVLEALNFVKAFVLRPVIINSQELNSEQVKKNPNKYLKMLIDADFKEKYHKFDERCKELPSIFDILFRINNKEFKYQLHLLHNEIIEENLYMREIGQEDAEIIFERSKEGLFLGNHLNEITKGKLKGSMPLLSHLASNYEIDVIDDVISWLSNVNFLNYDNPITDRQISFPKEEKRLEILFGMLKEMDINISGIRIEKDVDGNIVDIYMKHLLENGSTQEILFEEESSGTRKLFGCLAEIFDCLQNGTLMIADELDAKLHPKLLQYIIELFTDPKRNKGGAQLLFTSHDMTTMNPSVFRRDEIWFCALNASNASTLYSLIAFKKKNGKPPRPDESYGKQYLEGRYGADPYLRRILDWEDKL